MPYFFFGGYRGGGRSKKSKRKQRKENWFEELNAGQCKELCKAVKVKCSGTKKDIVERLLGQEFLVQYAVNLKGYMIKIDALKDECRRRMLQVSGNKFDLVLRIVQHEHGTGGDTLKRAATSIVVDETSGIERRVAKRRKPSKPNPSTMYTRIQKKIQSCSQKKYQSHWGSKSHAPAVCSLVYSLLESLDEYTETDPNLVVDGCYAIVSSFVENFDYFDRPGYCQDLEDSAEKIIQYVVYDIPRNMVSSNDLDKLANIMIEWQNVAAPYGVLNNLCLGFDMRANLIRNGRGGEEEEEEDKKPPAAVVSGNKSSNINAVEKLANRYSSKRSSSTTSTGDCWLKVAVATTLIRSKGTASRHGLSLSQFTNKKSGGGGTMSTTSSTTDSNKKKRSINTVGCGFNGSVSIPKPNKMFQQQQQQTKNVTNNIACRVALNEYTSTKKKGELMQQQSMLAQRMKENANEFEADDYAKRRRKLVELEKLEASSERKKTQLEQQNSKRLTKEWHCQTCHKTFSLKPKGCFTQNHQVRTIYEYTSTKKKGELMQQQSMLAQRMKENANEFEADDYAKRRRKLVELEKLEASSERKKTQLEQQNSKRLTKEWHCQTCHKTFSLKPKGCFTQNRQVRTIYEYTSTKKKGELMQQQSMLAQRMKENANEFEADDYAKRRRKLVELEKLEASSERKKTQLEQQNSKRLTKEWHCQTCHKTFSLKPKGCFTQNHQVRTIYEYTSTKKKGELMQQQSMLAQRMKENANEFEADDYAKRRRKLVELEKLEASSERKKTQLEQQNSKRLTKEWHCQTCHKTFSLKPKGCFTQNHQVRTIYEYKKFTTKDEQRTKLHGKSADDDGLTLGSGIDWSNGNDRVGQNRFN